MPYDEVKGTSPSKKGKLTIGKENSSLLSWIYVLNLQWERDISISKIWQESLVMLALFNVTSLA